MDFVRGIKETPAKPFRGGPETRILTDRNDVTVGARVKLMYLSPLGAMAADFAALLIAAAAFVNMALNLMEETDPQWLELLLPVVAYIPLKFGLRHMFRFTVKIDILEDAVVVTKFLLPVRYSRNEDIRFAASEKHDQADLERARHEVAARKDQLRGKAHNRTKYFEFAKHLLLVVGGECIKVADIHKGPLAVKFAQRCNRTNQLVLAQHERRTSADMTALDGERRVPGQLPE